MGIRDIQKEIGETKAILDLINDRVTKNKKEDAKKLLLQLHPKIEKINNLI